MKYKFCGRSGLQLPVVSLGLWQNFGSVDIFENGRAIIHRAFESGITHFDLANNYGPLPGSAEENFGRILSRDFTGHLRDELIISSKAGFDMWEGPYGKGSSRKYLVASLDQSLRRMGLDYVDIFYSHRYDEHTPIEETMMALDSIVRQGKALYAGISNYEKSEAETAIKILKKLGTPCLIHQPKYSMLQRTPEDGLFDVLEKYGVGCIPYSPLAQGLLTSRYLKGIPSDSRAARPNPSLKTADITQQTVDMLNALNNIAMRRGQTLAQLALSWVLREPRVTTVLIGASSVEQLNDNLQVLSAAKIDDSDLAEIERLLSSR
jgi:L-glyceraldehyde 3-phosphate reductase